MSVAANGCAVPSDRGGSLRSRVIEIFTAAAVGLAWFVFRYDGR
jgi:hypothetical protein